MGSDSLSGFKSAVIFQKIRDAGRPELGRMPEISKAALIFFSVPSTRARVQAHRLLSVLALNEWGSYSDGSSFGLSVSGTSDFDFNMKLTHARIATYECF
jgi:hypothetical protein